MRTRVLEILREQHVSLVQNSDDFIRVDPRFILTASAENVDLALRLRYSPENLMKLIHVKYSIVINKAVKNYLTYKNTIHTEEAKNALANKKREYQEINRELKSSRDPALEVTTKGIFVGQEKVLRSEIDESVLQFNGVIYNQNVTNRMINKGKRHFGAGCDTIYENEIRKSILKDSLEYEAYTYRMNQLSPLRLVDPRDTVTCILHMYGRCSEKLIKSLLNDILQNHMIDEDEKVKRLNNISLLMGKTIKAGTWGIEIKDLKKGTRKATYTLDFNKARKVMTEYMALLDIAFTEDEKNVDRWVDDKQGPKTRCYKDYVVLFGQFNIMMHGLRQMTVLTENDITILQDSIDAFEITFCSMFDQSQVTGYFHQAFSGHLREMIRKYGSIACMSQEGWEGLMGEIKRYVLRCTTRNGCHMLIAESAIKHQMRKLMRHASKGIPIDAESDGEGALNIDFRKWLAEGPQNQAEDVFYQEEVENIYRDDLNINDENSDDEGIIYPDSEEDEEEEEFI